MVKTRSQDLLQEGAFLPSPPCSSWDFFLCCRSFDSAEDKSFHSSNCELYGDTGPYYYRCAPIVVSLNFYRRIIGPLSIHGPMEYYSYPRTIHGTISSLPHCSWLSLLFVIPRLLMFTGEPSVKQGSLLKFKLSLPSRSGGPYMLAMIHLIN